MPKRLAEILPVLEALAPLRLAESWDNVGLLVGDPAAPIARVLVTVDYAPAVAEEARALEADLVVAYHPPLFAPVKRAPHGALWVDAIRRGIALYSMHTALDVVAGGTNDFLADVCGVTAASRRALRPRESPKGDGEGERDDASADEGVGLGRVGDVPLTTLGALVTRAKEGLGLPHVLVAGASDHPIQRVAVAAGAGGELLRDAYRARADVFVTGEIRHHDALEALRRGTAIIAALHSNSERAAIGAFAKRLAERLAGVAVHTSTADVDPFVIA